MKLNAVHVLVTSQSTYEDVDCFIWGGRQVGSVLTRELFEELLAQIREQGTIRHIYFEGGESFVFYHALETFIGRAAAEGLIVGIVSNGFWATSISDGRAWLRPLMAAGLDRLELTDAFFKGSPEEVFEDHPGFQAARKLRLQASLIPLEEYADDGEKGRVPPPLEEGDPIPEPAEHLTLPWSSFSSCPKEKLHNPERIFIDPKGNIHICRGLVIGNINEKPLITILGEYIPSEHPVAGPLLEGGPAGLARHFNLPHKEVYANACRFCREARHLLSPRFPEILVPTRSLGLV